MKHESGSVNKILKKEISLVDNVFVSKLNSHFQHNGYRSRLVVKGL